MEQSNNQTNNQTTNQTNNDPLEDLQRILSGYTEEELDHMIMNEMTHEDRERLIQLTTELMVARAQQNARREQQEPPAPTYEECTEDLPSYDSIKDSPPDY